LSFEPSGASGDGEAGNSTRTVHVAAAASTGTTIGPYSLLRELGEGGMGVVYQAQQREPIRRDVALKIIKPGMDSKQVIARFESERQALALMDHPNIARVFDAGTTAAGLPYFVMELVDGVPITRYCDSKRFTVAERITLMIPVCRAIQHAHQKGIIHRDLKPSNILVTEQDGKPVPKVIDFGLAKALGPQRSDVTMMTNLGTVVGTLDYMSPEQADLVRQDADTRTDVYSLGAVLYELLTGTTPLERERLAEAGYVETLRRIRDEETPPPSSRVRNSASSAEIAAQRRSDSARLPKLLHHELDWIAMKALEKDRARRYETANGMARDLERYLAGEPVEAAPPSTRYRLGKFVRKHRAALGAAAGFAFLLIAGIAATSWMAIRASRAEQEARAVNEFLRDDVLAQAGVSRQARPDVKPDPHLEVRTALDRAAARIEHRFRGQPAVEAGIRQTISEAYSDLGIFPEAQKQVERALQLRRQALGERHPETLESMFTLATIHSELGNLAPAEQLFTAVYQARRSRLGDDNPDTLKTAGKLGQVFTQEGKYGQAEALLKETLERQRRVLGPEDYETLGSTLMLGNLYLRQSKWTEAAALFRSLYDTDRRVLGEEHPETLRAADSLAAADWGIRNYGEAEAIFSKLVDVNRRTVGEDHSRTLIAMNNLAVLYDTQGKFAQAEALYLKVLESRRRVLGERNPDTLLSAGNLGGLYYDQGAYVRAEPILVATLEARGQVLGKQHPDTAFTMFVLGQVYRELGKYAQAEPLFAEALAVRRRVLGEEQSDTVDANVSLGEVKLLRGNYGEAEAILRESLASLEKIAPGEWSRYNCQTYLGSAIAAQKRFAEAEPMLLSGYDGMMRTRAAMAAADQKYLRRAIERIEQFYLVCGKPSEAAAWHSKLIGTTAPTSSVN